MTLDQIITQFELQVNDITELSTVEEQTLANRIYRRICNQKPWEFLRATSSGNISSLNSVYYITLPSDFSHLTENNLYTNNAYDVENNAAPIVIFIGTQNIPYQVINYSDRRQYLNRNGYAYVDIINNQIVFTGTPQETTYSFDYIKYPSTLTSSDSPLFPARFHEIIVYGMASENDILQLSEKARSYQSDNLSLYNQYLSDMSYWNANLIIN